MKKIYTAATTRLWDKATIKEKRISSLKLMEHAAEALTESFTARWNEEHPVIIFAGSGNNGGDGVAMARLLSEKGYLVQLYVFQFNSTLSPDTAENIQRLPEEVHYTLIENIEGITEVFTDLQEADFMYLPPYPIIIDALFGSGLNRPLSGYFIDLVLQINGLHCDIVSIDIPSGLHSENNANTLSQCIIQANVTFAIQRPKLAHLLRSNQDELGEIEIVPIGLSEKAEKDLDASFCWLEEDEVAPTLQQLQLNHHFATWSSDDILKLVSSDADSFTRLQAIRHAAETDDMLIHYIDMYQVLCSPDGMVYFYE